MDTDFSPSMLSSTEVRESLIEALGLVLVGARLGHESDVERAEQEHLVGIAPGSKKAAEKKSKKRSKKSRAEAETGELF